MPAVAENMRGMSSDLEELEEFERQTAIRVNQRNKRGKLGWSLPPNISRASASRESTAIAKPAALIPDARLENEKNTLNSTEGGPDRLIISEPVTCYSEMIRAIRARVGQLGVRYLDFDKLAGWAEGMSGKAFGAAEAKRLGPEKMFDALRAAGLRLRIEVDPEQTRDMQIRIANQFKPRQSKQARMGNRSHLSNALIDEVLSHLANKRGGLARLRGAVKQARSNWARHASKAFWEKKRSTGDFAAYAGNVSRISSAPTLRPPELSTSDANAA
jgi:hypothetical protein